MSKEKDIVTEEMIRSWKNEGRWFRVNSMTVFDSQELVGSVAKTILRMRVLQVYTIAPNTKIPDQIAISYDETQFSLEALGLIRELSKRHCRLIS